MLSDKVTMAKGTVCLAVRTLVKEEPLGPNGRLYEKFTPQSRKAPSMTHPRPDYQSLTLRTEITERGHNRPGCKVRPALVSSSAQSMSRSLGQESGT